MLVLRYFSITDRPFTELKTCMVFDAAKSYSLPFFLHPDLKADLLRAEA